MEYNAKRQKAVVLSGGGARGAYQVGVLKAVAEVAEEIQVQQPFCIFSGISAGAINAVFLASYAKDFIQGTKDLATLWSNINSDLVFRSDVLSLGRIGMKWMGELSLGGVVGTTPGRALLDTSPLGDLIRKNVNFQNIEDSIKDGTLRALAITALDYQSSTAITFVQGADTCEMWERSRRRSEKSIVTTEHVLASSAIPLLFSPVKVDTRFFGDGCVRNQSPLSPSLHLGATDLLVIGVRRQEADKMTEAQEVAAKAPSVARVMNVLLNSVLLDGIEVDMERLRKINDFLSRVPEEHHASLNFRPVDAVWIHPSKDIGALAGQLSDRLPKLIRYLLKGLGPLEEAREIISYLLFDPEFCQELIRYGYEDGLNQKAAIREFLGTT